MAHVHIGLDHIIKYHTQVSRMNSKNVSNEINMFLNELKNISVLNKYFGLNINLYTLEFVHSSVLSYNIRNVF